MYGHVLCEKARCCFKRGSDEHTISSCHEKELLCVPCKRNGLNYNHDSRKRSVCASYKAKVEETKTLAHREINSRPQKKKRLKQLTDSTESTLREDIESLLHVNIITNPKESQTILKHTSEESFDPSSTSPIRLLKQKEQFTLTQQATQSETLDSSLEDAECRSSSPMIYQYKQVHSKKIYIRLQSCRHKELCAPLKNVPHFLEISTGAYDSFYLP